MTDIVTNGSARWLIGLVAVVLGAGALALVATRRAWMRPAAG